MDEKPNDENVALHKPEPPVVQRRVVRAKLYCTPNAKHK